MRTDDELMALMDQAGHLWATNPEPTGEQLREVIGSLTPRASARVRRGYHSQAERDANSFRLWHGSK
jgi:hypothetical protein